MLLSLSLSLSARVRSASGANLWPWCWLYLSIYLAIYLSTKTRQIGETPPSAIPSQRVLRDMGGYLALGRWVFEGGCHQSSGNCPQTQNGISASVQWRYVAETTLVMRVFFLLQGCSFPQIAGITEPFKFWNQTPQRGLIALEMICLGILWRCAVVFISIPRNQNWASSVSTASGPESIGGGWCCDRTSYRARS